MCTSRPKAFIVGQKLSVLVYCLLQGLLVKFVILVYLNLGFWISTKISRRRKQKIPLLIGFTAY